MAGEGLCEAVATGTAGQQGQQDLGEGRHRLIPPRFGQTPLVRSDQVSLMPVEGLDQRGLGNIGAMGEATVFGDNGWESFDGMGKGSGNADRFRFEILKGQPQIAERCQGSGPVPEHGSGREMEVMLGDPRRYPHPLQQILAMPAVAFLQMGEVLVAPEGKEFVIKRRKQQSERGVVRKVGGNIAEGVPADDVIQQVIAPLVAPGEMGAAFGMHMPRQIVGCEFLSEPGQPGPGIPSPVGKDPYHQLAAFLFEQWHEQGAYDGFVSGSAHRNEQIKRHLPAFQPLMEIGGHIEVIQMQLQADAQGGDGIGWGRLADRQGWIDEWGPEKMIAIHRFDFFTEWTGIPIEGIRENNMFKMPDTLIHGVLEAGQEWFCREGNTLQRQAIQQRSEAFLDVPHEIEGSRLDLLQSADGVSVGCQGRIGYRDPPIRFLANVDTRALRGCKDLFEDTQGSHGLQIVQIPAEQMGPGPVPTVGQPVSGGFPEIDLVDTTRDHRHDPGRHRTTTATIKGQRPLVRGEYHVLLVVCCESVLLLAQALIDSGMMLRYDRAQDAKFLFDFSGNSSGAPGIIGREKLGGNECIEEVSEGHIRSAPFFLQAARQILQRVTPIAGGVVEGPSAIEIPGGQARLRVLRLQKLVGLHGQESVAGGKMDAGVMLQASGGPQGLGGTEEQGPQPEVADLVFVGKAGRWVGLLCRPLVEVEADEQSFLWTAGILPDAILCQWAIQKLLKAGRQVQGGNTQGQGNPVVRFWVVADV